jgi:hypothetical protein
MLKYAYQYKDYDEYYDFKLHVVFHKTQDIKINNIKIINSNWLIRFIILLCIRRGLTYHIYMEQERVG